MNDSLINFFRSVIESKGYETEHVESRDPMLEDDHIKIKGTNAHVSLSDEGFFAGIECDDGNIAFRAPTLDAVKATSNVQALIKEHG